jgi:hypothetical protein
MTLYAILPYFWLLLMLAAILSVVVVAVRGRPKKVKSKAAAEAPAADSFGEPSLDFGDEVAQMESR